MQPRHVDLRGLSLEEVEAKIRDMIDATQREALATAVGADFVDEDAVERWAEIVRLREQIIEMARASRGGKDLH